MPSFVWDREPSEAYGEPYEYGAQEQFARESKAVVQQLKSIYELQNHSFKVTDQTPQRAVWMLQVDALSALSDAIELVGEKRFRVASRLFRDIVETLDASYYFALAGDAAEINIKKWYQNEVISHRIFRDFVRQHHSPEKAENLRGLYTDLSKYTHRTFRTLGMSYILGRGDTAIYDGFRNNDNFNVLPHVLSFSYAILAGLIKRFVRYAVDTKQISTNEEIALWAASLEKESVPRRFGFGPVQVMRGPDILLDEDIFDNEGSEKSTASDPIDPDAASGAGK